MARVLPASITVLALALSGCATTPSATDSLASAVDAAPSPGLKGKLAKEAYLGPYWMDRAAYPTGHFSPHWMREAAEQAAQVSRALPLGTLARRSAGQSLDPNVFTPLGPRPLGTGGGIAGRTNVKHIAKHHAVAFCQREIAECKWSQNAFI